MKAFYSFPQSTAIGRKPTPPWGKYQVQSKAEPRTQIPREAVNATAATIVQSDAFIRIIDFGKRAVVRHIVGAMNTITKTIFAGIAAITLTAGLTQTSRAQAQTNQAPERIGVYDSRAIAVVFGGSAERKQELIQLRERRDKAKAAGDLQKVAALEAEEKAQKAKVQRQAFGTEPVDEILQYITNALPRIKKDAGVTALISKWNEGELKKHPGAERIDVTTHLVDAFNPSPDQRKAAMKILNYKPVSREQAENMK